MTAVAPDISDDAALPANVAAHIQRNVRRHPDRPAFVWLDGRGSEEVNWTFNAFWSRVTAVAHALRRKWRAAEGEHVLLVYERGPEFLAAFIGCLLAGCIAVPVYPPVPADLERGLAKLAKVAELTALRLVLTSSKYNTLRRMLVLKAKVARKTSHAWPSGLTWAVTDTLPLRSAAQHFAPASVAPDDPAFVQFTSGSTGDPKGVVITHANIIANMNHIKRAVDAKASDVVVAWVPLYHDLGLVGMMVQNLILGATVVMMSPLTFLRSPYVWLKAITDYKARFTAAPNFAYELCVRKISPEQRKALHFPGCSFLNCAEPVRADTIRRFADAFGECGFVQDHMLPFYGMAEATLFMSGGRPDSSPSTLSVLRVLSSSLTTGKTIQLLGDDFHASHSTEIVGCGLPASGTRIVAVDPETHTALPADTVGELWVSSPSVSIAYHGLAELTQSSLKAELRNATDSVDDNDNDDEDDDGGIRHRTFLRTGDLGFVHESGEIFVCGRLKNILIIGGRNHYPQDIEATCNECTPHLRPGCAVVFSVPDPETEDECVVIVAEVRDLGRPRMEIVKAVTAAVSLHHGLHCHDVVLILPRTLPKTTSGKPRHRFTREMYMTAQLDTIFTLCRDMAPAVVPIIATTTDVDAPGCDALGTAERLESRLLGAIRESLDLSSNPERSESLQALGLSSMQQVELTAKFSSILGREVAPDVVVAAATIRDLLDALVADNGTQHAAAQCDDEASRTALRAKSAGATDIPLPLLAVGILQLLGLLLICLLIGASALPSYHFLRFVFEDLSEPWASLTLWGSVTTYGLLVPLAIPLFLVTLSAAVIATKWVMIGRYRKGQRRLHTLFFVRWWTVDRLVAFWEQYVGMFIGNTILLTAFYKLCGARIAWSASVKAANLRDFDLIEIGALASVDGMVLARELSSSDGLMFATTRIGGGATVCGRSLIGAGCRIEEGARLQHGTVLLPFSTAAARTTYAGNPGYVVAAVVRDDDKSFGHPDATVVEVGAAAAAATATVAASHTKMVWQRLGLELCKLLGMLSTLYIFFLVTMCISASFWELVGTRDRGFRYMALVYWVVTYIIGGLTAAILGVLIKWMLLGRVRPGLYTPSVLRDAAVFVVNMHQRIAFFLLLRWLSRTMLLQWWMRAYGVKIGRHCILNAINFIPAAQADLFEFEDGVFVSAAWFFAEDADRQDGRRELTRIVVKHGAEVGVNCVVGPNVVLGEDSLLGIDTAVQHEHVRAGMVRFGRTSRPKTIDVKPGAQPVEVHGVSTTLIALAFLVVHAAALVPAYELAVVLLFENSGSFWNGDTGSFAAEQSSTFDRNVAVTMCGLCILAVIVSFWFVQLVHQTVLWGLSGAVEPKWFWHYPLFQGLANGRHLQFTFMLQGSILYVLFLRALGAKVAWSAVLFAMPVILETHRLKIGAECTADHGARIIGHVYTSMYGGLYFDRVEVEPRASLMPFSTVWPDTYAPEGSTVQAHQVAPRR
eukprot:m.274316 g.274316  ORF g.274316 m.274316 type:complete len:1484 (+) comp11091_c1_seq2:214-4665(+)